MPGRSAERGNATTRLTAILPLIAATALAARQSEQAKAPTQSGPKDFAMLCAPCHRPGGKGDRPDAEGLGNVHTDLTGLAAGNNGVFPMPQVMGHVWGYTEVRGIPFWGRVKPNFGSMLDSERVLFDAGDGIATPTPSRLVELAEYLKGIQG